MTQEDRDAELGIIEFSPEYHEDRLKDFLVKNEDDWLWEHEDGGYSEDEDIQWEYFCPEGKRRPETVWDKSAGREVINEEDKLLVFTTGRKVRSLRLFLSRGRHLFIEGQKTFYSKSLSFILKFTCIHF